MFELKKYKNLINIGFYVLLFFLIFNFKFENDEGFIISQVLYCGYLLMILQLLRSNLFKYVYEPPVFFLLFSFIYEFLKFPYYFKYTSIASLVEASHLLSPTFAIEDYYANSSLLLIYQIICILVLLFFYLIARKKNIIINKVDKFPAFKNDKLFVIICFIFLVGGFIGLYKLTNGNILYLLSRRSGNDEAAELLSANYLVSFSSTFNLITFPILIGIRLHLNRSWRMLLFIYIPAMILSYLTTGARGFIIYSLIIVFILFSFKKNITITSSKIIIIGISAILIFSVLGLVRRSTSDNENILENIKNNSEIDKQWYFELSGYQLQFRDEMTFANADRVGFLYGKTYLNLIFFPFPRSILGELKPNFIDKEVAKNFWRRNDVGLPLNSMTESYYNFSYFGFVVFAIMGTIMAKVSWYISTNTSLLKKFMAIVLLFYAQTWSTTYLVYVLQYVIIAMVLIKFMKMNNADKSLKKIIK
jgi:oligosaccharide repeat unit polymerase